jgi:hypothetical protein
VAVIDHDILRLLKATDADVEAAVQRETEALAAAESQCAGGQSGRRTRANRDSRRRLDRDRVKHERRGANDARRRCRA